MSPAEIAAAVYESEPLLSFRDDLEAHFLNGYVFSTPEGFVMGRPVRSTAEESLILDPWHRFPPEECDAWWVWLAAGDFGSLLPLLPYHLPLIGWQRAWKGREALHFYPLTAARKALTRRGLVHKLRDGVRP